MVDFCGRDRAIERDGAGERGWFERIARSGEDAGWWCCRCFAIAIEEEAKRSGRDEEVLFFLGEDRRVHIREKKGRDDVALFFAAGRAERARRNVSKRAHSRVERNDER